MKKITIILACFISTSFYVLAANDKTQVAAQVPWSIGELVATGCIIPGKKITTKINRYFLGMTPEGYYRVQEFYIEKQDLFRGKKYPKGVLYTAPYNLVNESAVTASFDKCEWHPLLGNQSIEGAYAVYNDDGTLNVSGRYEQGKRVGDWFYYYSGKVYYVDTYKDDVLIKSHKYN